MRRNGKTTRKIDKAIQVLFEKGSLYVPGNVTLFSKDDKWTRGIDPETIFADTDARPDNTAQRHFFSILERRLFSEHRGCYKVDGYWIRVISENGKT